MADKLRKWFNSPEIMYWSINNLTCNDKFKHVASKIDVILVGRTTCDKNINFNVTLDEMLSIFDSTQVQGLVQLYYTNSKFSDSQKIPFDNALTAWLNSNRRGSPKPKGFQGQNPNSKNELGREK